MLTPHPPRDLVAKLATVKFDEPASSSDRHGRSCLVNFAGTCNEVDMSGFRWGLNKLVREKTLQSATEKTTVILNYWDDDVYCQEITVQQIQIRPDLV